MASIFVGVCGFKKKHYSSPIRCVEIQRTFYNIPQEKTVQKWRNEAPEDFIFNIKVFQGMTHDCSSPTWRRYSKRLSEREKKMVGSLRLNDLTLGWIRTYVKFASILRAKVLVVQTPAKFSAKPENVKQARSFFERFIDILREENIDTWVGWEPRGDWLKKPSTLEDVFSSFDRLVHIVDPFFYEPAVSRGIAYFRLHGKPYLNYRYEYSEEDLDFLMEKIDEITGHASEIYLMFNNVYMDKDAMRLIEKLRCKG